MNIVIIGAGKIGATLTEQLLRQRRADLAGSDDNNVHSRKDSCMVNFKMIRLWYWRGHSGAL